MRTLLPIIVLLMLIACRKSKPEFDGVNCTGNCYILTGRVLDTPSNTGLQGVELKFYYRSPNYSFLGNATKYLGRTVTDRNGDYQFQFDGTKYKTGEGFFWIQARKKGYIYDPFDQNEVAMFYLDSTRFNQPVTQNFPLFRPANLTVRFRAINVTNFEFLTFHDHYGGQGTGIILNGRRRMDTTITFRTAGDIRTFIQWHTSGNGIHISKNDTLFVSRNGTVHYQIDL